MKEHISAVYTGDMPLSADAKWIHAPNARPAHWYVLRREFDVSGAHTLLAFGACHYAEVYINGTLAMRACERSYLYDIKYKCIDISELVVNGKNTITVIMDKMFDANRLSDIIAQIDCDGNTVLVSDSGFRALHYAPLAAGANFFPEGAPMCESYDARLKLEDEVFMSGFDDSAWQTAECEAEDAVKYTLTRITQDKNAAQTSAPVFAKKLISLEQSIPMPGFTQEINTELPSFCEAEAFAECDSEICIENMGGIRAISLDGDKISFGERIKVEKGAHRLAIIGKEPRIFISGDGIHVGKWRAKPIEEHFKGKRIPRFPWNDISCEEKLPSAWSEFLYERRKLLNADDFCGVESALTDISALNSLKYRKYFSCDGAWTDSRLCHTYTESVEKNTMCVTGAESLLQANGCMVVPPSGKDTTFIMDFGTVHIGGIHIDAEAAEGTRILFHAFEAINDSGVIFCSENRTMSYICADGKNEYTSHTRKGFRYLMVNIPASDTETVINNIYLMEWRYPAESVTEFDCSDVRLNNIYDMSVNTAKACMLDAYVDCPGYEQNIWVGDARVTALVNLANFGCYDFNHRFLSLVASSLDEGMCRIYRRGNKRYKEGRFLPCASFPTYPEGNIPIWSYMWLLSIVDHYKYTGDKGALEALLPAVEETFSRSARMMSARGLLSINGAWNLIEWANNDVSEYGECVANSMMLSYCLREFSQIYSSLGREAIAREYADRANDIKSAINKYAWIEARGAYVDTVRDAEAYAEYVAYYSEIGKDPLSFDAYMSLSRVSVQTNTFAILYGIADGERKEKALDILVDNIEKGIYISGSPAYRTVGLPSEKEAPGGIVHIGSPFFMFFALEALFKNGYAELAITSIRREWGDMLDSGINTCTESFNSKTEWKTRSVAHSWSASPAIYLITELLGVKPAAPGFTRFTVNPCHSSLSSASGRVPTPYGYISVSWEKSADGTVNIKCDAPDQCLRI